MGKGARQASARERIRAQRAKERRREKQKRIATIVSVVVLAVGAVGAGMWYAAERGRSETVTTALAPITVQADGTVVMAKEGVTAPVLDIYEDFQCPACKALEETSGPTIKNLAAEGKVKVVFHPITIFQQEPTSGNSIRAGAAARCVSDGAQWMAYHDRLFEGQPAETVEGFKVDDLVAWGKEVGVTAADFEECVTSQRHAQAHQDFTKKVLQSGVITQGTPTLVLDGQEVDNNVAFTPSELRQTILDAAQEAGK